MKARLMHIDKPHAFDKIKLWVIPQGQSISYSFVVTLPDEYQGAPCRCCNGYHFPSMSGLGFPPLYSFITIPDSVQLTPYGE